MTKTEKEKTKANQIVAAIKLAMVNSNIMCFSRSLYCESLGFNGQIAVGWPYKSHL